MLCDIVRPKIGILTGISEQHMATFGSQDNIIKAKYELVEALPIDGAAFFNGKNKYCLELYKKTEIKKYLYGQTTRFFGEENILGAEAAAKELKMTDKAISKACQKIENKLPGIEQKQGIDDFIVFDASYSANPDSVIGHLEYLRVFPGKKVIVMSCLIELGKASKEVHERIGKKIAEICDLAIITTKDRLKEIKQAAFYGSGIREIHILFMENPKKIFKKIKDFCGTGDIVLLEGRLPQELIKFLTEKK